MVDITTVGTYTIRYNVSDAAGNAAAEVTRTVIVAPDTTPPVITLIGAATVNLALGGSSYTEPGATATDNIDGDISGDIIISGDVVDTNTAGTYTIRYNVSDAAGNAAAEVTRTVIVAPDTTPPVITLTGAATVNLALGGSSYTEPGATATDNTDGDISGDIVISGDVVDTNTAGTYTIRYNVSDAAGNAAAEVTRTVIVAPDTTPPVITLTGAATVNLALGGSSYTEPGATATDNIDGDISGDIVISGDVVDITTVGTYTIRYNVSDAAGNAAAEVTRIINVNPFDDGLLTNGSFQSGADSWYNTGGAVNIATVGSNKYYSANVTSPTPTKKWRVNLSQRVELMNSASYTLTFDAWSDRDRKIVAGLGQAADPFRTSSSEIAITSNRTTYSLTLTVGFDTAGGEERVLFDNAAEAGEVNIDNVSLVAN